MRDKTLKHLQESTGEPLRTQKYQSLHKGSGIRTKNFCSQRQSIKKRQTTDWENIFYMYPTKALHSECRKNANKPLRKRDNPVKKKTKKHRKRCEQASHKKVPTRPMNTKLTSQEQAAIPPETRPHGPHACTSELVPSPVSTQSQMMVLSHMSLGSLSPSLLIPGHT